MNRILITLLLLISSALHANSENNETMFIGFTIAHYNHDNHSSQYLIGHSDDQYSTNITQTYTLDNAVALDTFTPPTITTNHLTQLITLQYSLLHQGNIFQGQKTISFFQEVSEITSEGIKLCMRSHLKNSSIN